MKRYFVLLDPLSLSQKKIIFSTCVTFKCHGSMTNSIKVLKWNFKRSCLRTTRRKKNHVSD